MDCCGSKSSPRQNASEKNETCQPAKNFAATAEKTKQRRGSGITKNSLVLGLAMVLVAGMSVGYFIKPSRELTADHLAMIKKLSVDEQRESFIALAANIKAEMAKQGKYNCCIEKPCTYCIEKTPGHGEDAACECMDDILAGRHPCGECIGEILEGHGEPELKAYFAKAIAHKVGAEHESHLQEIIDDMYQ
jgi:hypothetical protein